ncbi:hypothetical protein [Nocardioides xinjiangensis]|uniref:hypothetical protein n=1 Tax=Nocardioides xinjiangensis TaxID=2817376 RepID=UPI001B304D4A|nr:hypothetical protein [Nocardioides sp. SYSU D00514]
MNATPRTALAVAVAVIALVLSAGAGATASLLITGNQIKDGTVASRDIKNRSLKVKDLSARATAKLTGAAGPVGPRGATGPAGPAGASGLSGFEVVTRSLPIPGILGGVGGTDTLTAACPEGKKAIAATAAYAAPVANLLSQVTRTSESAFRATGVNLLPTPQTLSLEVVCAAIPG